MLVVCFLSVVKLWPYSPCFRKPVMRVCEHWQRRAGGGWFKPLQIASQKHTATPREFTNETNLRGFGAERSCDLGEENHGESTMHSCISLVQGRTQQRHETAAGGEFTSHMVSPWKLFLFSMVDKSKKSQWFVSWKCLCLEAVEARLERLGHEPAIISMSRPVWCNSQKLRWKFFWHSSCIAC